jgi:hypothetical protein
MWLGNMGEIGEKFRRKCQQGRIIRENCTENANDSRRMLD